MPAVRKNALTAALWRVHPRIYRLSRGRLLGRIGALDVVVLTTRGRRTGDARAVALMAFEHEGSWIVCGSNAGLDNDPAWVLNLRACPEATVEQRGTRVAVVGREAVGDERVTLWSALLALDPAYDEYRQRTERQLPVVVLTPSRDRAGVGTGA